MSMKEAKRLVIEREKIKLLASKKVESKTQREQDKVSGV